MTKMNISLEEFTKEELIEMVKMEQSLNRLASRKTKMLEKKLEQSKFYLDVERATCGEARAMEECSLEEIEELKGLMEELNEDVSNLEDVIAGYQYNNFEIKRIVQSGENVEREITKFVERVGLGNENDPEESEEPETEYPQNVLTISRADVPW